TGQDFDERHTADQPDHRRQTAQNLVVVQVVEDVGAYDEIESLANVHFRLLAKRAGAHIARLAELFDDVFAGVVAYVADLRPQLQQVRQPRRFAAADVDDVADRAAQEVFGHRDRQHHFPADDGLGADACAAAIPAVEVGAVVLFHLRGVKPSLSQYSRGIR